MITYVAKVLGTVSGVQVGGSTSRVLLSVLLWLFDAHCVQYCPQLISAEVEHITLVAPNSRDNRLEFDC